MGLEYWQDLYLGTTMKTCKEETPNVGNLPLHQRKPTTSAVAPSNFFQVIPICRKVTTYAYGTHWHTETFFSNCLENCIGSTLSGNPRDHEGFACYHFRTRRTAVALWWLFFTGHLNLPQVARKCVSHNQAPKLCLLTWPWLQAIELFRVRHQSGLQDSNKIASRREIFKIIFPAKQIVSGVLLEYHSYHARVLSWRTQNRPKFDITCEVSETSLPSRS